MTLLLTFIQEIRYGIPPLKEKGKIPDHLFVAVAVPAPSGEGFIINGLRYTLCEVTGLEKIPPGIITEYSKMYLVSGRCFYEMVR